MLNQCDIMVDPHSHATRVSVMLHRSKAHLGVTIQFGLMGHHYTTCYMVHQGQAHGPFFKFMDGSPLYMRTGGP